MATAQLGAVVRHIRELVDAGKAREQTDGALLRAFLGRHDQAAFEALVQRHGSMVLRVCRRTLGDAHDTEDAVQATFLLLAQRASSIRKRGSLASWLHGVAYRMATHAKRAAARRRAHEAGARTAEPPDPAAQAAWRELQAFLDQEIEHLPEGLRAAFILCCLEYKSSADAARQLGVEEAALRQRLSRARKVLKERLARRGVSLTAVLAAAALGANGALAAVPRSLVASTVKAASLIATGKAATAGLVPIKVAALIEGVQKAMFFTKLKTTAVVLLTVALAGTGGGLVTYRALAAGQQGDDAARAIKLVEQLGSDRFAEREKAAKELDRIGAPALEALRKGARSDDAETKQRAEDLVKKIEARSLAADLLTPKRVHLFYKDTPLAEAITDFTKQSGYQLSLSDPEGKLKGRTITLDTGEVTFWQALGQFCQKASLVEIAPPPALAERLSNDLLGAPPREGDGEIVLTHGSVVTQPTDDRTSVRVRAEAATTPEGREILVALQITPEPKLRHLEILAVHIRTATDNEGRSLEPVSVGDEASAPPADNRRLEGAPPRRAKAAISVVHLKKGAKAAASLRELSGMITAYRALEARPGSKSVTFEIPFTLRDVPFRAYASAPAFIEKLSVPRSGEALPGDAQRDRLRVK